MKVATRKTKAKRILLVDDDASRRNIRAVILFTHGYDVHCVPTISAAITWAGSEPDLLLIGGVDVRSDWRWLERIGKQRPKQRVGFLLNEGETLCAVQFEGELLLAEEGPGDLVSRVEMLLQRGSQRRRLCS